MAEDARRIEPASEEELAEAVRAARAAGQRVRATGARGSKSGINTAPDLEVGLQRLERPVTVEGRRVTAPAGITCGALQGRLRDEGLALPTVGEWKEAAVAGCMATATHGGSAEHGILSTSATRLRIVTGTGEVVELGRGDPEFRHAGVSLGALGVVTEVTLACEDRFALELVTDVVPFEAYVDDPLAQESRTEFHASIWVPWARRVVRFAADRTDEPDDPVRRRARFGTRTAVATFLARRLGIRGAVSDRVFGRIASGDLDDILSPLDVAPAVVHFRNRANEIRKREAAELAFDASRAPEVLRAFDEFFRRRGGPLNNPLGLRMTAADDFSLSPCSGRDTLWMDIFYDVKEPFVTELAALAEELDARCHWGKALALPPRTLRHRYPDWEVFRKARSRFDPDEVFANRFTDALGLTGGGSAKPGED